jgi:hypothetical protein
MRGLCSSAVDFSILLRITNLRKNDDLGEIIEFRNNFMFKTLKRSSNIILIFSLLIFCIYFLLILILILN